MLHAPTEAEVGLPFRLDAAALAPSEPIVAREVTARAAEALARLPGKRFEHLGRGPVGFDWLGMVRAAAQAGRDHRAGRPARDLTDLTDYVAGDRQGLSPDQVQRLFESWGMLAIPARQARRGDLILFATPAAHAAVMVGGFYGPNAQIAHAPMGCAPGVLFMGKLAPRARRAFTWERG